MRIRLLAIDLDGTLLTSERAIHPQNALAIARAREADVTVVLASGRVHASMAPFKSQLGLEGPTIAANGSVVLAHDTHELAFHGVDPRVFEILKTYALSKGVHLNVYTRTRLYYLQDTEWLQLYRSRVKTVIPEPLPAGETLDVSKLMIVDSPEANKRHAAALTEELAGLPVLLTESEPEYLEFLSPQADKGVGLRLIAEHLGLERSQVAAIGDYLNDLGMLRYAGFSGAVANAHEDVRATVSTIVRSNEEAGVAEFIDSVVLNRQE